jgi:hypothetical protein
MKTNLTIALMMTASIAMAQVMVPDGTQIRVHLVEDLSSDTAQLGAPVEFAVADEVRVVDTIVIASGARATGNIVKVSASRRMSRAGQLDFTIERVQAADGTWYGVRYTLQKNHGKNSALATGVAAAGLAASFWPATPAILLKKGQEAVVTKDRTFSVYVDNVILTSITPPQVQAPVLPQSNIASVGNGGQPSAAPVPENPVSNASPMSADGPPAAAVVPIATATAFITANVAGADIEIDGVFVGSTPGTLQLAAGMHKITIKQGTSTWDRDMQVTGGSNVNVTATLAAKATVRRTSRQ